MSDQSTEALSLDEVTRRFADSEQALEQARQNLEKLAQTQQSVAGTSEQLQDTARLIADYARAAGDLIGELAETQRQARAVLEAGVKLLDGSEMRELADGISELRRGQDDLLHRVGDVEAAEARAKKAEETLASVTANLSSRTRKKLGLS